MTSCGHRRIFKGINLLAERHFNGKTAFVQCASRGACLSSHDRNETENATERGMERAVSPEAASFDPRMALMARRPLDDVTHACKVARLANRNTREARRTAPLMTKTPRTAVLMALMLAVSATHAAPLPPRKPSEFAEKGRNSAAPGALPGKDSSPPPGDNKHMAESGIDECIARLETMGIKARAAVALSNNNEACVVPMPIRIEHVTDRYGNGNAILFPNEPLIDCQLAEPLAHWLGEIVAPVFAANFASPLKAIRTGPGYECRNRNHETTGKLSAHATGLALDISGFELANGQILSVGAGNDAVPEAVLRTIRTAGCGWFTTILGPGSNAEHANHLHLDIQRHGSNRGLRICE